jgi:DNA-binding transcriptional ArsR family regulator
MKSWDETTFSGVRLHKALAHPIRLQLFNTLSSGAISPAQFARRRGEPVSNVTYHFRRLLELGCIELVEAKAVKGAVEHVYRRATQQASAVRSTRLALDEKGWLEVVEIFERMSHELAHAEAQAMRRTSGRSKLELMVSIFLFGPRPS